MAKTTEKKTEKISLTRDAAGLLRQHLRKPKGKEDEITAVALLGALEGKIEAALIMDPLEEGTEPLKVRKWHLTEDRYTVTEATVLAVRELLRDLVKAGQLPRARAASELMGRFGLVDV